MLRAVYRHLRESIAVSIVSEHAFHVLYTHKKQWHDKLCVQSMYITQGIGNVKLSNVAL